MSADALENGAEIARVHADSGPTGAGSQIARLDPVLGGQLASLAVDRNNPHVFGLDAREVFFMDDGIILTEGQEDVVHYRRMAVELGMSFDGDFYGWGVGGADKMPLIARLLAALGFRHVVGILDGNKREVAENLKAEFPAFTFIVIPEADVRSKREVAAKPAVKGLLDHQGTIMPEHQENARRLIMDVNAALAFDP